jgi:hypothetical protein
MKKILLVSFLFITTNLFALSQNDDSYYIVDFSPISSFYSVDKCFDNKEYTRCASKNPLIITFNNPVNIHQFSYVLASDNFNVGDIYFDNSLFSGSSVENVSTIRIEPGNNGYGSFVFLSEISFDFSLVDHEDDISNGINWSMFAYSFTIIGILALLGRAIKALLDVIKFF